MNDNIIEDNMMVDYGSYKWLISSCLQKSLRRGRFDLAKNYVNFLWEHDRNYLTYRFSTILSEDVGIANVDLINEYLATNIAKRKIDEAGGLDFILSITKRACESIKDRSSCDSAYIASYYPLNADSLASHRSSDKINTDIHEHEKKDILTSIFLDKECSYIDRINAGWTLLGNNKFDHHSLPWLTNYGVNEKGKSIDNLPDYLVLCKDLTMSNEALTCIEGSYNTQRENICLGMPIVQDLYNKELHIQSTTLNAQKQPKFLVGSTIENTYIKETTFIHPVLNMELISAGIDGHTREGKTAYYKYLKTKNDLTQYLYSKNINQEEHMLILSHCIFRTEGHEVNKRLFFPSAVKIMRDCEQNILDTKVNRGEKYLDFTIIKNILLKDIEKINAFRLEVLKNASTPLIEKPIAKVKKIKV